MFHIGIVSVSFRNHTVEEIMEACQRANIDTVEWGSDVHAPCLELETLRHLAKLQQEKGICCSSYGTYFKVGVHRPEEIAPYIEAARILGTRVLRIWCGTKGSAQYTSREADELLQDCRQLARIAEEKDVVLCLEYHPNTYSDCKESVCSLLEAVGSPHFRTYWQPNQFTTFEENLLATKWVAPLTENIHVFYFLGSEKRPLAEAKEPWAAYLGQFSGDQHLLLEFMPDGKLETLVTEAQALRKILELC